MVSVSASTPLKYFFLQRTSSPVVLFFHQRPYYLLSTSSFCLPTTTSRRLCASLHVSLFVEGQHRRIVLEMVHNRNKSFIISEVSFAHHFSVVALKQKFGLGSYFICDIEERHSFRAYFEHWVLQKHSFRNHETPPFGTLDLVVGTSFFITPLLHFMKVFCFVTSTP